MEKKETSRPQLFKGAGIIMGIVIGSLTGIAFVSLTGVMGFIGAVSAAVALPLSLLLEKKFRRSGPVIPGTSKTYLLLTALGTALFFICFFAVK